jgi:hypothetical protein
VKGSIRDRELDKFRPASGDKSKIAVIIEQDEAMPVEIAESIAQQILKASDRQKQFAWLDFGTRNERISEIIYTAQSVGDYILTKTFSYSLFANAYRLDGETLFLTGA